MTPSAPNRLIDAASPYLRQHAYNPVDWHPWGDEALGLARREDKPIFLSIGYSTCHWCHVMAHECFENPDIAAIMNQHFVNIKLDREERPDLDETYMHVVITLTGRGGWPLSLFLTPELRPYYGGTYFPPEDRGGLPGFARLLTALAHAYRNNQAQIDIISQQVIGHLGVIGAMAGAEGEVSRELADAAAQRLLADFDPEHGGLGAAPKFPRSLELGFLLHYHRLAGDPEVLDKLRFTLEKMVRGGLYDQVGGGFHRYAVDRAWAVPHFEKMLYDNALLPPLYLAHYQITGNRFSRFFCQDTLDFVLRDMTAPQGGFYAAWDADSEGEEGKFYVWSLAELEQAVGPADAPLAAAALGVTKEGNFEGKNVLSRPVNDGDLAARFGLNRAQLQEAMLRIRATLAQARSRRTPPHRDEKIITAWNALMISALAQGGRVLGEPRYIEAAVRAARFILAEMVQEGRLMRIWNQGQAGTPGFSEDYALLALALLDLWDSDFDPQWLVEARRLLTAMDDLFLDEADGAYFFVARDQDTPLVRSKSVFDQTLPSGNSAAARAWWKLSRLTGETQGRERAMGILQRFVGAARDNPWGQAHYLTVASLCLMPPVDLAIVGDPAQEATQEMLAAASRFYLPEMALTLKTPANAAALAELVPASREYQAAAAGPAAYLCRNYACQPPIYEPAELAARLKPGGQD